MDWIEELDKHGHNFLIDELVWHIEQGRIPVEVAKCTKDNTVGYEFRFEKDKPMFLKVVPDMIDDHWKEALEITSEFPQLESIRYVVS